MKLFLYTFLTFTVAAFCGQKEPLFQGEELIFPASATGGQMFSAVLVTKNRYVVVFDGGRRQDNANLIKIVKEYSDTIDLWILTHAHSDHVYAIAEFLEKTPEALTVRQICHNFPSVEWLTIADKNEKGCLAEAMVAINPINKTTIPKHIVKKGERLEVDGVTIDVLNEPNPAILGGNPINNTSIVYNVNIAGKKMLVTGDIGIEMGEQLVRECPEKLKADICILSHHGQNGANKRFYETVMPTIAIWPTPKWLWDNDEGGGPGSGSWKTNYVKCWMQDLKVRRQYTNITEVRLK